MIALLFVVYVAAADEPKFERVINAFDTVARCEKYKLRALKLPDEGVSYECRAEYVITRGPDIDDGR